MALKKPSDFFVQKEPLNNIIVVEKDDSLQDELSKVENLSEQLNQLQQELTQKVIRSDLESLVLSEINRMRKNFADLHHELQNSNQNNINKSNVKINEITEIVNNLVEIEIPNYKKRIIKNEVSIKDKISQFQQLVENNINEIREDIENKFTNIADVVDNNIDFFNQQLLETSSQVKKTSETYSNLSKIFENKILKENEQLEEYSEIIKNIQKGFVEIQQSLSEKVLNSQKIIKEEIKNYQENFEIKNNENFNNYKKQIDDIQVNLENSINNFLENYHTDIVDVKTNVTINEKHIKNIDKYLEVYHQDLIQLKQDVFSEIENIPVGNIQENLNRLEKKIDFIKETYSKLEPEVVIKEIITESVLNEPASNKTDDPLTPINQNFVTLDQLQQHYRLFLNRIQQQLSTIGGGGETRFEFLDDIDRNSVKTNGYIIQYNSSLGKFIGTSYVQGSGGGGGDTYWSASNVGIFTTSKVAIGTDQNQSSSLFVEGNTTVTGIITANAFVGDGSGLTGVIATSSGVQIKDNNSPVGAASTLNFASGLGVTFSSGTATINVSIPLSALTDVDTSNLTGISTDYLMVYDPSIPGFKFVDPKSYFGINNDYNPSPDIDDYGNY